MSSLNHVEIATWQFKALQQATMQKRSHLAFGSAVLGFASSEGQLANGQVSPPVTCPLLIKHRGKGLRRVQWARVLVFPMSLHLVSAPLHRSGYGGVPFDWSGGPVAI
jgi:hypothetical protein